MAGNPVGKSTWLYKFMSLANSSKLTVDFITIHWYSTPNLASSFLKEIDDAYQMYNRPIWITEFACADWDATASNPTSYTPQDVIPFMKTVIPGLLNRTYVERFSWFSPINPSDVNLGFSALFYVNGSLTELGKLYASFGVSYSTDEDSSFNDTVIALSSSLNTTVASSSINRQFSTGYPNRATSDAFIVQGLESLLLMIILILASLIL